MAENHSALAVEIIEHKILFLRGQKVMIDTDLASLYGVKTKVLLQAVKRNAERFPEDFMFILNNQEVSLLRSQICDLNHRSGWSSLCSVCIYGVWGRDALQRFEKPARHSG